MHVWLAWLNKKGGECLLFCGQYFSIVYYSVFKEKFVKDSFTPCFSWESTLITGAYVDLGNVADKQNQTGWYLSGQLSY